MVLAWNIRHSLYKNEVELGSLLISNKVDIAALLECDLKDIDKKHPPTLEGYKTFLPAPRGASGCVRLLLLVNHKVLDKVHLMEDLMNEAVPSIWFDMLGKPT